MGLRWLVVLLVAAALVGAPFALAARPVPDTPRDPAALAAAGPDVGHLGLVRHGADLRCAAGARQRLLRHAGPAARRGQPAARVVARPAGVAGRPAAQHGGDGPLPLPRPAGPLGVRVRHRDGLPAQPGPAARRGRPAARHPGPLAAAGRARRRAQPAAGRAGRRRRGPRPAGHPRRPGRQRRPRRRLGGAGQRAAAARRALRPRRRPARAADRGHRGWTSGHPTPRRRSSGRRPAPRSPTRTPSTRPRRPTRWPPTTCPRRWPGCRCATARTPAAVGIYGRGPTALIALPLRGQVARPLRDRLEASATARSTDGRHRGARRAGLAARHRPAGSGGGAFLVAGTVTPETLERAATELAAVTR